MSFNKGMKVFKQDGEDAVANELQQVDNMNGFIPYSSEKLTKMEKKKALRYLMYLKEKRCGRIKACGCADGRKQ